MIPSLPSPSKPLRLIVSGSFLMSAVTLPAALVVHYTFDNNDATNSGTLSDGRVFGGVTYEASGAAGGAGAGNAAVFNRTGADDAGIDTELSASLVGIAGTGGYTTMAWIKYGGALGDNMVFGQNVDNGDMANTANSEQLHNGIRHDGDPAIANMHLGHWAGDLTDLGTPVPIGEWVHVAYSYDGTTARQYLNGVENGMGANGGLNAAAVDRDITIGWTDRNDGGGNSFDGSIDDVKIFNEALDAAGILAASQIPEPGTTSILGLVGIALLLRRRRG